MINNSNFFYSGVNRSVVITFGSLFSNIKIERSDNDGVKQNSIRVPISYGPKMKWLVRLLQDPNLNDSTAIDLPRMSFELTGYQYANQVNLNKNNYMIAKDGKTQYTPVPYDLSFSLYIMTKNQDDGFAIVEQILPWFQPDLVVQIMMNETLGIAQNVPFNLTGVQLEDNWTGKFEERRAFIHTLTFTVRVNYFRPVEFYANGVIKKATVGVNFGNEAGIDTNTYSAEVNPREAEKTGIYTIDEYFNGNLV